MTIGATQQPFRPDFLWNEDDDGIKTAKVEDQFHQTIFTIELDGKHNCVNVYDKYGKKSAMFGKTSTTLYDQFLYDNTAASIRVVTGGNWIKDDRDLTFEVTDKETGYLAKVEIDFNEWLGNEHIYITNANGVQSDILLG